MSRIRQILLLLLSGIRRLELIDSCARQQHGWMPFQRRRTTVICVSQLIYENSPDFSFIHAFAVIHFIYCPVDECSEIFATYRQTLYDYYFIAKRIKVSHVNKNEMKNFLNSFECDVTWETLCLCFSVITSVKRKLLDFQILMEPTYLMHLINVSSSACALRMLHATWAHAPWAIIICWQFRLSPSRWGRGWGWGWVLVSFRLAFPLCVFRTAECVANLRVCVCVCVFAGQLWLKSQRLEYWDYVTKPGEHVACQATHVCNIFFPQRKCVL